MIPNHPRNEQSPARKWPEYFSQSLLLGIFVLLLVYIVDFAQAVLIPAVLALFLYMVLRPAVRGLDRIHVPRMLGAAITLVVAAGVIGFGSMQLIDPAREWISTAPERITTIERKVKDAVRSFDQMRKYADEMGNLAMREDPTNRTVSIKSESLSGVLLGGTQAMITKGIVIIVLLYFLLVSGDRLWIGISRRSPKTESASFMKVVRNIESRLSVYLLTLTIINACTGLAVGLGMFLIGMPNPVLWGVLAGLVNFVPYLGAMVGETIVAMVALFSFDSVGHALLAPLIYFLISFVEGNFITPMILGKQFTINPVMIILSMMFWGWIWGIIGLFLAVPILVLTSVLLENIPPDASAGRLSGEGRQTAGLA